MQGDDLSYAKSQSLYCRQLRCFWSDRGLCADRPETAISGNAAPALAALSYSWKTDYAGVLTPPVEIQQKAHAACIQREFERAFMTSISFEHDQATAVFSCRGAAF